MAEELLREILEALRGMRGELRDVKEAVQEVQTRLEVGFETLADGVRELNAEGSFRARRSAA